MAPDVISTTLAWVLGPLPRHDLPVLLPVSSRKASASPQRGDVRLVKIIPAMQLQQGGRFRGCSHSLMFRLPHLLGPPIAPTAASLLPVIRSLRAPSNLRSRAWSRMPADSFAVSKDAGQPGRLHRAMDRMLPFLNCGIATRLNRVIGAAGLSPAGLWPCRPLQSGRNSARAPRGGREAQPVEDRRPFFQLIGHVSPSPPPIRYSRISRVRLAAAAFPRGSSHAS